MISDVQLSLKFITKFEDSSIFDTIYPLILKANIGRDAPDIILSKKPSSQLRRKSKSSEYENHESKGLRKNATKVAKVQKIDFNLKDEDKEICSFIFSRDKTNSLRSINQTRNYEENQKYNRNGFANQSHPKTTRFLMYKQTQNWSIYHGIKENFDCDSRCESSS